MACVPSPGRPPIVGWLVAILFFGAALQSYYAYVHTELYQKDPKWTKAVLHSVMLFGTVSSSIMLRPGCARGG